MALPAEGFAVVPPLDGTRLTMYQEDCAAQGHLIDVSYAVQTVTSAFNAVEIVGPFPGYFPHIVCRRCNGVWLIPMGPGNGYEDALMQMKAKVLAEDSTLYYIPLPTEETTPDHTHEVDAPPA